MTVETQAWEEFRKVVDGFLGNKKSPDYEVHVKDMICRFQDLGCRMSVKMHFLDSRLDNVLENLGEYSEKQGGIFHQVISEMERRYRGRWK